MIDFYQLQIFLKIINFPEQKLSGVKIELMSKYLKALKTEKNVYALWETQSKKEVVIICKADGSPASSMHLNKTVDAPKQALIPVKKNQYVMIGCNNKEGEIVSVYRVIYPFTNNHGVHLVKVEEMGELRNGTWNNQLPKELSYMVDVLLSKLRGFSKRVVAKIPLTLKVSRTKKGFFALYENCGRDESTIVCTPGGGEATSVFVFDKEKGKAGRQAIIPIFGRYKILRGRQTDEGQEISIYKVVRTFVGKGGPQAEVELVNHYLNGKWQTTVPCNLRPVVNLLIEKIEMRDTETLYSKMK